MPITVVLATAVLLAAFPAHSQSLAAAGQIEGAIFDSASGVVPNAAVQLRKQDTSAVRMSQSDSSGRFQFRAVPIGEYSLTVTAPGFATTRIESLLVSVGQTVFQRVTVSPAGVSEKLDVHAETEAIQTSATTTSVALGYDRVEETPSQNRNYLSFVFAAPGMSPSAGASTQRSAAGTRNVANDSGFVFAGLRGRNNSISIDGVDNRDETTGGNRVAIGLEMVQEFRVSGTSVSAEFGGAAGGIVNVVTRSGSNLWHGDATMFLQNESLNARNAEISAPRKQQYRRYQPGASLSGPIRRDRTFFATAVETAWESGEEWSETTLAQKAAIGRNLTSGFYPANGHDTESSLKFDHMLSTKHHWTSRYAYSRGWVQNDVLGVDNFSDLSARGSSLLRDHAFVSGVTSTLSPSLVNDLRVQLSRRNAEITPNSPGVMIEIPGIITFGGAYRLDQQRTETHVEAVDSVSIVRGAHMLSIGGSVHHVQLDARLANRFAGLFVFPTLADFQAGRADVFLQAFGEPQTNFTTMPVGFWLQDRWQPRHGLTIEAGLRLDRQQMPAGLPTSSTNFAPRLGVAWRPGSTSTWVFRAGAGLFFDRYPLAFLNDPVQKDGTRAFERYATGAAATRAYITPAAVTQIPIAQYSVSQHFPSTYAPRITAGVERAFNRDTTFSLEYTAARGLRLPRSRNIATAVQPRYLLEQTARSSYQGATLTLNRRMAKELTYLFSYTIGRTQDDASDYDEQPNNPTDLRAEWALSRQHQVHRFTASLLYEPPLDDWEFLPEWIQTALDGLTLAPMFTSGSGRPLNALDATDSFRSAAYPLSSRPFGLGRNPFYSPATHALDLRVFKVVPILNERAKWHLGLESFNLLNHTNPLRVSPFYAANGARLTSYGRPIEILNARQVQLFAALEF